MSSSLPRRLRAVLVLVFAVALALPSTAVSAGPGAEARDQSSPAAAYRVTLITGDVVRVTETRDGRQAATVERAPGAVGGVRILTVGDDLHVVPDEVLPLLAADRLDPALFNVSGLIEQGYDDAHAASLPLIAQYGPTTAPRAWRTPPGAKKTDDLPSVDALAMQTPRGRSGRFWTAVRPPAMTAATPTPKLGFGIAKLWLDRKVRVDLAESVPQIGAPEAWAAGFDGTGVTVAVLDTGIDAGHPDLAGRIGDTASFVPDDDVVDENGHGTHVASTIAGSGAASGGTLRGVAPGAELAIGKVLGDDGYGQSSWVIAGMEWAAARADVVSMSLGDPAPSDGSDPLSQALNELTATTGALFVVAAGNDGAEFTVGSPGVADAALTVAAVDDLDQRAWFSSMGPRFGDQALKPDIAAPGVDILAARASGSWGEGDYTSLSGTSMATPHVSAAAAILVQRHPDWGPERLKDALMSSASPIAGASPYEVGTGRLWIPAALEDVHATGSAYFGLFDWPHDGDAAVERSITYTNAGATAVTLSLAVDAVGPAGPTDLFSLGATEVTVPAGGSASVTLAADPDDVADVGRYTGFVVAADATGATRARTAIGLVKEDERYDLDVEALDRSGKPVGGWVTLYRYGDWQATWLELDPATGRLDPMRLPAGVYTVSTWLDVQGLRGPDSAAVAMLGTPHLVLDRDRTVTLDARAARPVTVTTPKPSEDRYRRLQWFHDSGIGGDLATFSSAYVVPAAPDDMLVAPTGAVPGGAFDFAVRWRRSAPQLTLAANLPRQVPIAPLYQQGSARLDGRVQLAGVEAGDGSAAAYAGLDARGRAVVVTRSDAVTAADRAAAAEAAGAALLVVVNDRPGRYLDWAGSMTLPVVSLTAAEGAPLVSAARAGQLTIRGSAIADSPYIYDLTRGDPTGVPAGLAWAPRERDLAQVAHRFVGAFAEPAYEARYDCRAYQWPPCLGAYEPVRVPFERTDYVSTERGNTWYQDAIHPAGWEQRHDQVAYRPGQRAKLDWFSPVTRPRLGPGFWGPYRDADVLTVNVPTASGDSRVTGTMWDWANGGTVVSRLYRGDELIAEQPFQAVYAWPVPDEPTEYRFEQDTTRPAGPWRLSTRTHSAWTFSSARPPDGVMAPLPLLQLDYDIATDLAGDVAGGRKGAIGISASFEPGVVGGGRVAGATLGVSFDEGLTWQPVRLRAVTGGWQGEVMYPRPAAPGTFVSVRASAWDDAGNRVEQEVIRAVGLR